MNNLIVKLLSVVVLLSVSLNLYSQTHLFGVKVGEFDRLKVSDKIDVVYGNHPDSIGYAYFECDNKVADALIFTNKKGTLKIQVTTDYVNSLELPQIRVYSKFLCEAENTSDGTLYIKELASGSEFKARVVGNGKIVADGVNAHEVEAKIDTGNGSVVLSGECSKAKYKMCGTGTIQADGMKATEVHCSILGTGSIGCWPEDLLKVKGIGSTKIYYKGNPNTIKKSGGGNIISLDSAE